MTSEDEMKRQVSIVIPSYNGKELLSKFLPGVITAMERIRRDNNEIIIIDNGSTDGTGEFLKGMGKSVTVITLKGNSGFARACNLGIEIAKHDIVILLNNDVEVREDFIYPLLEGFDRDDTFAVVARSLLPHADMRNESITIGSFEEERFQLLRLGLGDEKIEHAQTCTNLYAAGGFSAFHKEKFLKLGGFDSLYFPFYWEDVDISYRAWKMGWRIIYEPRSVVYHHSHGTISREYLPEYIDLIYMRNRYLFIWRNLNDEKIIKAHAENLLQQEKSGWEGKNSLERKAFFEAFRKIRDVMARRESIVQESRLMDEEILKISANMRLE